MAPITGVLVLEAGIEAACVVGAAVGAVTSGCPKGEAEDDDGASADGSSCFVTQLLMPSAANKWGVAGASGIKQAEAE